MDSRKGEQYMSKNKGGSNPKPAPTGNTGTKGGPNGTTKGK